MTNEIITTLHPDQDPDTDLYPNIKKENIPNNVIDMFKLSDDVKNLLNSINELHPSGTDTSTNILAYTTNKGIYVATDNGHWYYWDGTQYVDGGEYLQVNLTNYYSIDELYQHFASINHEKNYLDINSCIDGYYVNYGNGDLYQNSDLKVTQFIELKSNTDYCLANLNMDQQQYNLGQMAFYDENQDYISGETNSGLRVTTFNTGSNIKYVRVSLPIQLTMVQLEEGTTPTTFENYHKCIDNDILSYLYQDRLNKIPQLETDVNNLKPKVVTVGSGGDYSTILQAILSTTPDVKIHVLSGVYNIVEEYKTIYGNDFWDNYTNYFDQPQTYRGLYLENGREIYGDGDTILTFFYDGDNENVKLYFSVLAPTYDNYIHDLTISISPDSCRYAIHDDFANHKGVNIYERLIISGSPKANALIGAGCGQDNVYVIKDCIFINNTKLHDISYHGNTGSSGACRLVVSGCMGSQKCAFRWLGTSTQITYITISNCKFGVISCEAYDQTALVRNMEMFSFNNTETN